ncbi:MAG TPA: GNAT family N-acetyltransferase [Acidobacteriota bacterium]|nr:GNAT family N-acetyltransferase [Acidobacteriota bacterium]
MTRTPEVRISKTIDEIGRAIDSIADDGFFTYGYFKTLETSKPFNTVPLYLSMYDEDKIIAATPCYIDLRNRPSASENRPSFMRRIVSITSHFGFYPDRLLVCSSPSSYHSKILVEKNLENKAILGQMCSSIDDVCKKENIPFSSFPYVSEFEDFLIRNLPDFGYLRFPSDTTLSLDVQWSSFEDYLASLESHKIRTTVRREIKKCKESGVTIAEEPSFGNLATTLTRLHSCLFSKYNKGLESPRGASFFEGLSEYAKDKTRVFVAKRNNKIVGFSLSLQQKDTLDVHLCGFDYDTQASTDFVYFNVVYYATIKMAIEEGIKRIHYSIKSERIKQKRGCKPERTYSFIKCHNRLLRPLYNFYTKNKRIG